MTKLVVEQVYPSNSYPVALVSEQSHAPFDVKTGQLLRCGGYTFCIERVLGGEAAHQRGLELRTEFAVRPGMVLRPCDEPLGDDEVVAQLMRVTQLLHQLSELDPRTVEVTLSVIGHTDVTAHLKNTDVLDSALKVFKLFDTLKMQLPTLVEQRKLGAVVGRLNEAMQLMTTKDTRATIGS